ncbi:hypothetical protein HOY80DRAFT_1003825 [Tuber brumale]|nr:hypothetical protein HOY80DRAFT_1003825 [Tuber brumale]
MVPPNYPATGPMDVSFPISRIPHCHFLKHVIHAPFSPQDNLHLTFQLTDKQVTPTLTTHEIPMCSRLGNCSPISTVCKQVARPNTAIHYPLFVPLSFNLPCGQLSIEGWERASVDYPDKAVITAILRTCRFGARIGYGEICKTPIIHPNLSTAQADPHLMSSDIAVELSKNRLKIYSDLSKLPNHYTASPLGLINKLDGRKRPIHHLSYSPLGLTSMNSGIPETYETITYITVNEAIQATQELGKDCMLVKRDFESVFSPIPISPLDLPLLAFRWEDTYYSEEFLRFGL